MLGAYTYRITYRLGREILHADGLSRLPLPEQPSEVPLPGETILLVESLERGVVNARRIKSWTGNDPILSRVHQYVMQGWPMHVEEMLIPYQRRQEELSIHDGCIVWGSRVIVSEKGQESVVDLHHEGHPGISRMKSLARSFVCWTRMDKQLEGRGQNCQSTRHLPPKSPFIHGSGQIDHGNVSILTVQAHF